MRVRVRERRERREMVREKMVWKKGKEIRERGRKRVRIGMKVWMGMKVGKRERERWRRG